MSQQPLRRFVQITSEERPGFVEFSFSINDPSLFLEMILPVKAFDEFYKSNDEIFLSLEQIKTVEEQQKKWNGGDTADISLITHTWCRD